MITKTNIYNKVTEAGKRALYLMVAPLMLASCVDTVILPDNKTVDDDYWQKKNEVDALVGAAYAQLRDESAIRNMIVWGDFRSDELVMTTALPVSAGYRIPLQQIYSMNIETENAFTGWAPFYSAINYCNLVLERAEGVVSVDPDYTRGDYEANRAQMLALRAWCYFYLSKVFHDVPVTPHAYMDSSDDLNAVQVSPDTLLNMCIADLQEASKYAVAGNIYGDWRDRGYLNQDGINAILADIYLWRGSVNRDASDYQACVDYCDKVIQAKKTAYEQDPAKRRLMMNEGEKDYYLSTYRTMYADLFGTSGQNADESIWELQFQNSSVSNRGLDQMFYRYSNASGNGYGYLKAAKVFGMVDQKGDGVWLNDKDQRLKEYVYDANGNAEQFGVRKNIEPIRTGYLTAVAAEPSGNRTYSMNKNWILYRLTDVMLMKAEALVQLYQLGGSQEDDTRNEEAFNLCKFVNDRTLSQDDLSANQLKYTTYRDKMEQLVLAERARELCFEGKRFFDLMRYNYRHTATKANLKSKLFDADYATVLNSTEFFELALRKYAVPTAMRAKMRDERYLYMPINQDETEVNPALVQNPVYKSAAKY